MRKHEIYEVLYMECIIKNIKDIILNFFLFLLLMNKTIFISTYIRVDGVNGVNAVIKLPSNAIEDQTVYPEYKVKAGSRAELGCNVTIPSSDDAITLILWYRGNESRIPIYSVDAREDVLLNAIHFRDEVFAGNRAFFNLTVRPALLQIDPVLEDDGMEYRCRVDFRWGRTMNTHVFLNVIVPPNSIVIKDSNGTLVHNTIIGPYNQGIDVMLTCLVEGGSPPPSLHWYRNGTMIDGSYIIDSEGMSHNHLVVYKLSPNDLNVEFVCEANTLNYTTIRAHVMIDINFLPSSVVITSPKTVLSAGRKVEIICETKGSRPPAVITWLKNNKQLTHSQENVSFDGNTTTSVLNLMPTIADNNALLVCRAHNLRITHHYIEYEWKLQVFYDPKITLTIGKSTKPAILKEGSEAVMECSIKANPIASDIHFLINGSIISDNEENGVFIENSTLIIQNLRPEHRGRYRCSASNIEGKADSNEVMLDIRYSPICKNTRIKTTIAMTLNETIVLRCIVDAQPTAVSFYWTFNNYELHNNYTTSGLLSELSFSTRSEHDFGLVSCWAKNEIGMQSNPCLFVIITSVPPLPLNECVVLNKTISSITIECVSGESAGLHQTFYAQVLDSKHQTLVKNISVSTNPLFFINHLSSGTEYSINLFAINSKGKSLPKILIVSTLSTINTKLVSAHQELEYDPFVAVLTGALFSLILIIIIIIIICKIKEQDEEKDKRDQQNQQIISISKATKNHLNGSNDELRRNPDVIPCDNSFRDSTLDLFMINDLQSNALKGSALQNSKSIVNQYTPIEESFGRILKTENDLNEEIFYSKRKLEVFAHQIGIDEFDGIDIQQTDV